MNLDQLFALAGKVQALGHRVEQFVSQHKKLLSWIAGAIVFGVAVYVCRGRDRNSASTKSESQITPVDTMKSEPTPKEKRLQWEYDSLLQVQY